MNPEDYKYIKIEILLDPCCKQEELCELLNKYMVNTTDSKRIENLPALGDDIYLNDKLIAQVAGLKISTK